MADTDHERTNLLAGYQLRLPTYEGPLDVLLRLIERSQLAIEDLSLLRVTDQFLAFITGMRYAPPDIVADFAAVGARLALLKSRSLLPRPLADEEEDQQSDITVQLREYKQIKDAARKLGDVHAAGRHAYTSSNRGAILSPVSVQEPRLAPHEPELLIRSLRRRLSMVAKPSQLIRQRRIVNLRDVVDRISALTRGGSPVRFSTVVSACQARSEVATSFLAVLLLVRRQSLAASQDGLFADISLQVPDTLAAGRANGTHHRPMEDHDSSSALDA